MFWPVMKSPIQARFWSTVVLCAALARTEGRIALEETFKRFPEWSVDMDGAVPLYTSTVRGYTKLPINV